MKISMGSYFIIFFMLKKKKVSHLDHWLKGLKYLLENLEWIEALMEGFLGFYKFNRVFET